MSEMAHYELPHGGYNGIEIVGEFAYKDAILRALPRLPADGAPAEATVPVEIVPEPDNPYDRRAVSVRAQGRVIGYLPRDLAADYHLPIKRIVASGARVRTNARIYAYKSFGGEVEANVRVGLPDPEDLAPLNSGYPATTSALPYGRQTYQVVKEDQHFQHLFEYVPKSGKGPVMLTLHKAESMLRNGNVRRTVEVRLDGEKAGELTAATSAHYLPVIDHADGMGRVVGVWGTITGSGLAAELTIKGAKSTELSDEWLREMPVFPHLVPEAHSYEVPDAYQGEPKPKGRSRTTGSHSVARFRAQLDQRVLAQPPTVPDTPPRPTAPGKTRSAGKYQPPATPTPVPLSGDVVWLGAGTGPRTPIYYTVKGKQTFVDDRERKAGAKGQRRTAWAFIVITSLLALLLAGIPGIGPVLTLALLAIVAIAGPDQLRKAKALKVDPHGLGQPARDRQDREWGDVGEENQDHDGAGA